MKKLTYKEVKKIINSVGFKLISNEYIGASNPLIIRCSKGHEFKRSFSKFRYNPTCPHCKKTRKLTLKEIQFEIGKYGYELLANKYKNNQTPLKMKCPNGHIINMTYGNFQQGRRCKCDPNKGHGGKKKLEYDFVKNYIESEGYVLLTDEYINTGTKMLMSCDENHEFLMDFSHFKHGRRCPICNSSKGNKKVKVLLDDLNINYITEYKFKDCKFKKELPFDFYLPDYNCCIEYDGEQHFEIIKYFGGYNKFIDTKIRDTIKNIYCRDNNIDLLRIPYWEFDNIENILIDKLNLK